MSLLFGAIGTWAQSTEKPKNETLGGKISRLLHKGRKSIGKASENFGYKMDEDGHLSKQTDLIKVNGLYYMPLYTVNLYQGAETVQFRTMCRQLFQQKYPNTVIQTVVLPQTEWLRETVEKQETIVGYLQTMYCYIVARDGSDGYINAKFTFQKYKEVGGDYQPLQDKWPKWERTDILSNKIYDKLLSK